MTHKTIALIAIVATCLCLAGAVGAGATVVSDWNAAALSEVRAARLGPPIVARALAIAHTCMYDAWAAYDAQAVGTLLGGSLRRPAAERTDANKAEAISFAAYRCLLNLFPAGAARLNAQMLALGYDPTNATLDTTTPAGVGNVASAAVIADRHHDGANQYGDEPGSPATPTPYADYTGYVPSNAPMEYCLPTMPVCPPLNIADPWHWQPLIGPPELGSVTQKYIAPHWSNVRPFALTSATQYDHLPKADPKVLKNDAHYRKGAEEVLDNSAALTPERKLIVEYWADGPASELPPGHWGIFAQFVSARDGHTIDQDVKMFFVMHNASFDAGIVAWHLKRKFDSVRPITAIRYLFEGQLVLAFGGPGRPTEWIPGEKWMPYNPGSNLTPAFPSFISGHSTFSAASAVALEEFTGSDHFGFSTVIPAGFGRVEPGIPAVDTTFTYDTFSAAAQEAALSRLYGGIHFSEDNTTGLMLGERIGRQAWETAQTYFDGSAGQ
jgi:hypothetical protein